MNLRWLIGNYAQKEHGLTAREAWSASARAHEKHISTGTFLRWTIFALIVPVLLVFKFALPLVLGWLGMSGRNGPYMVGAGIVIALFWLWAAWVYKHVYTRPMRRAVRDTGRDICIECGYDLAGLGGDIDRCPECGGRREPAEA